jgi:hypothetical protein
MNNPNKVFLRINENRNSSLKMRINSRKLRKIPGRIWTAPKCSFETSSTQKAPRCIGMNATLTTFYLISEKPTKVFHILYSVSRK